MANCHLSDWQLSKTCRVDCRSPHFKCHCRKIVVLMFFWMLRRQAATIDFWHNVPLICPEFNPLKFLNEAASFVDAG